MFGFLLEIFLPYPFIQFSALVGIVLFFLLYWKPSKTPLFRNPFGIDSRRPKQAPEHDQKKRALRLKQRFSAAAVPSELDAIVIGSGIGGMSVATMLAKTGRKVLVLEQHDQAGGCMHTFVDQGYEWDVGIHYIGQMGAFDFDRFALDQLTNGQLDWALLDEDFDNVVLANSSDKPTFIPVWADRSQMMEEFKRRYPQHEEGLDTLLKMMKQSSHTFMTGLMLKLAPMWLAKLIAKLKLYSLFTTFFAAFHQVSLKSQLDRLFGDDEEIKTVINYCWGDYGVTSSNVGIGMLSLLYGHYAHGAYYPIGGSSEIAYTMIPVVEEAGGRVLVNAKVKDILLSGNKAVGVRIDTSSGMVDIRAPIVISDAGVLNTFGKMLPREIASKTGVGRLLDSGRLKPSFGCMQVFVGLKGSQAELKLPNKNFWIYHDLNVEEAVNKWESLTLEEASSTENEIPFLFVSFPSAKDQTFNDRYPGRSVCTILTSFPYQWAEKWKAEPVKHRGSEYEAYKMQLARRCWDDVCQLFPEFANSMDYIDAGTPLSTNYYLNAVEGETYGLDHSFERFAPDVVVTLRPEVPEIKNLFLTGQDVTTCGFVSSFYSGLLTAQAILRPQGECTNVWADLKRLFKAYRKAMADVNAAKKANGTTPKAKPQMNGK